MKWSVWTMHSDVSNFHLFLKGYSDQLPKEYSFLSGKWAEHQQWRTMAQSKVFELLGYFPSATPLDSKVHKRIECDGYMQEEISFCTGGQTRVEGSVLIPKTHSQNGKFPAVIALHSGIYYYGRQKIVEQKDEPQMLTEFKKSLLWRQIMGKCACTKGISCSCDRWFFLWF